MEELYFEFNPEESWYRRIMDIYKAAAMYFDQGDLL
jgi:hypothetical protein